MIQATSQEALVRLEGSGKLAHDEGIVLRALREHAEGATDQELANDLGLGWFPSRVAARRNGLKLKLRLHAAGFAILEGTPRRCQITGKTAIPWRLASPEQRQKEFWNGLD